MVIKLPPDIPLTTGVKNEGSCNQRSKYNFGIIKRRAGNKSVYTKTGRALARIRRLVDGGWLDVSANLAAIFIGYPLGKLRWMFNGLGLSIAFFPTVAVPFCEVGDQV